MSVPLMAFSHAITASLPAPSGRAAIPAAMAGATNFRMCAPTAVVTMSADAMASVSWSACFAELRAEYPRTTVVRGSSPTSCTEYESDCCRPSIRASATSANTRSYPAPSSSNPTKPRPMFPAPKWTAFMSAVHPSERVADLLRRRGLLEFGDLGLVQEHLGDLAQQLQVVVAGPGDADHEPDGVAVPVDAVGVPDDRDRRLLDHRLGLVGAVRDREQVAHVGGHQLLPVVHGRHVALIDVARGNQQGAGLVDRADPVGCGAGQHDG